MAAARTGTDTSAFFLGGKHNFNNIDFCVSKAPCSFWKLIKTIDQLLVIKLKEALGRHHQLHINCQIRFKLKSSTQKWSSWIIMRKTTKAATVFLTWGSFLILSTSFVQSVLKNPAEGRHFLVFMWARICRIKHLRTLIWAHKRLLLRWSSAGIQNKGVNQHSLFHGRGQSFFSNDDKEHI